MFIQCIFAFLMQFSWVVTYPIKVVKSFFLTKEQVEKYGYKSRENDNDLYSYKGLYLSDSVRSINVSST